MNNQNSKIIIGTAQFGSDYGITNSKGEVSLSEIKKIILEANNNGVNCFDTAPIYGNAEVKLGKCLEKNSKVITKVFEIKDKNIDKNNLKEVEKVFFKSLKNLKLNKIYALLIHSVKDLYKNNSKILVEFLENLKKNNIVEKLGISIYEKKDFENTIKIFKPDIIQIPINIFDQRLLKKKFVNFIKNMDIEIHARSIFLQGLLLSKEELIPNHLFFIKNYLSKFKKKLEAKGLKPMEACLSFINNVSAIDKIVVGVSSLNEFKEILNTNKNKNLKINDFDEFKLNNKKILNPINWTKNNVKKETGN